MPFPLEGGVLPQVEECTGEDDRQGDPDDPEGQDRDDDGPWGGHRPRPPDGSDPPSRGWPWPDRGGTTSPTISHPDRNGLPPSDPDRRISGRTARADGYGDGAGVRASPGPPRSSAFQVLPRGPHLPD